MLPVALSVGVLAASLIAVQTATTIVSPVSADMVIGTEVAAVELLPVPPRATLAIAIGDYANWIMAFPAVCAGKVIVKVPAVEV